MAADKVAKDSDLFEYKIHDKSILGDDWCCIYATGSKVPFKKEHFEMAMLNVIREPNINSTAVLRADILKETLYDLGVEESKVIKHTENEVEVIDPESKAIGVYDMEVRNPKLNDELELKILRGIVRRMVPRNPYKDFSINQTCLLMNSPQKFPETSLVIYTPHIKEEDECPFYIPHVESVGILLHEGILSVHYIPYSDVSSLNDESERVVRTAWRLLQTAYKHSKGVMQGYEKRVNHDQVVDKVKFQDRYIILKGKYSKFLIENWVESTDPKKHVFEDVAIAAFLIELWIKIYGENFRDKMQFRDLGCGNGVLCYILIEEGVKGIGIDARHRKSWSIYPNKIQNCLKEQVIIPSVLIRPHPNVKKAMPFLETNGSVFPVKVVSNDLIAPATVLYSGEDLLKSPQVNVVEFEKDTFIIGNHSDELTCWIPLLGYPFMVIPCCSHNLSGDRIRYNVRKAQPHHQDSSKMVNSTYAGLVDRVEYIAERVGWEVEKEMLRIPSTRNAAIIGYKNDKLPEFPTQEVYDILFEDGGPLNWVQNAMNLVKRNPRNH
ncbi:hypothetical protein Kpol_1007p16 [Vanderwaltozyma polyspora DSM 70294]|uniref:tRNA (uracil-O(2)-)-methyltransferase n=1 Tax=Vanderwaltozyma polyspora (strain ATCC 22028 / DSM 70294 / BCRC 21397 / CBS 2163 / NBRC 10782 / NRRL Y-8283 / UCD 57-17) TaxID=436907 RepID=A7TRT8_VANPO|nr:uncharacterized protein Kpol_1007p16 [Vanderwaltozyma polyspora DSM 70294]EDO15032.1 hypothetical protein Kpol_1007p16 [Vanderwaltozyma polyspora DSM 70294]